MRLSIAAAAAVLAAAAASPAALAAPELTPPPPSFLTCKAAAGGTICSGTRTVDYGPEESGLVCGTGADAFAILDRGSFRQKAVRYYDADGNLTRRVIHENYTLGQLTNAVTGTTVDYIQHNAIVAVPAVPGDLDTATETITGEIIVTLPHRGLVLAETGRIAFAPDGTIEFASGQHDIEDYFRVDPSALDRLCAALAAG
jgi:hypothetical protein